MCSTQNFFVNNNKVTCVEILIKVARKYLLLLKNNSNNNNGKY